MQLVSTLSEAAQGNIVGIDTKNMVSHFFTPPQNASQYNLPNKTDRK